MDPRTAKFLVFTAFCILSLGAGYLSRKRGWVREDLSKRIHFHTITWFWTLGGIFSLWLLPVTRELGWLLGAMTFTVALSAYGMIPLAKWIGCTRPQIGVMAIGAGISNSGVTLGAYLCYCMLKPSEPALAYGNLFASLQLILAVPLIYPIAVHFSEEPSDHERPIIPFILSSIWDIRSLGLFAGAFGIALSAMHVPYPHFVIDYHILDAIVYICAAGGYFGIGLRLRLGDSGKHVPHHALMAVLKFAILPLIGYGIVLLLRLTPAPFPPLLEKAFLIESLIPAGTSVVILANLYHLDARLASIIWVVNTALFLLVPLPIILYLTM
ncbi:MAG: AEC family transporter [Planctomycetes bacterium]|nr:AEC family transporter [Planctomycetota bacterium]